MAAPIVGEVVELEAVQPSAEERSADARGRIGNTAQQAIIPTATVTIGTWLLALMHVDLDPGAGTDMPAVVASAFTSALTLALALVMNRPALRAVFDELEQYRVERDYLLALADEEAA